MSRRGASLAAAVVGLASLGMTFPNAYVYGRVVLDNFATRSGVPPVAFDHWRHRALYTCRVCHVDVGFAMAANETKVSAKTNASGFHCGACHDGKRQHKGRTIFASCRPGFGLVDECQRCHARTDSEKLQREFVAFAKPLPRDRMGGVDWMKAEADLEIRPADFVEGVSIRRAQMKNEKEVQISSNAAWMSDVLFSHPKHAVWNGCEVCHPDIYASTRAGGVKYTMLQINNGESCGVCHDKVAFPLADCGKCHTKPVQ